MNNYRVRVTHEDRGSYAEYFGSLREADARARTLRAFINVVTGLDGLEFAVEVRQERQEYDWVSA